MLQAVSKKITVIREAIGVDIHIGPDDAWTVSGLRLKVKNGKVWKVGEYGSLAELREKNDASLALMLIVNGKGVLMRTTSEPEEEPLKRFLTGANPNDFYAESWSPGNGLHYHFICRKTMLAEILDKLTEAGLIAIECRLGLATFSQVAGFLEVGDGSVSAPSYTLTWKDQRIDSVDYMEVNVGTGTDMMEVGGMQLRKKHLAVTGLLMQALLLPVVELTGGFTTEAIVHSRTELQYRRLAVWGAKALLATVLMLLFFNFLLFSHYFARHAELEARLTLTKGEMDTARVVQQRLDAVYDFFHRQGWSRPTRHGFYLDRIAALVPPTVRLTDFQTALPQEAFGASGISFQHDAMKVRGVSADPTDLEVFSRALRNVEGVVKVTIREYAYKRDLSAAVFSIDILLHK